MNRKEVSLDSKEIGWVPVFPPTFVTITTNGTQGSLKSCGNDYSKISKWYAQTRKYKTTGMLYKTFLWHLPHIDMLFNSVRIYILRYIRTCLSSINDIFLFLNIVIYALWVKFIVLTQSVAYYYQNSLYSVQ